MASEVSGYETATTANYNDQQNPANIDQQNSEEQQISAPYKFNQEEIRAIKECNRESFFFRCLPIGTFLGSATYLAVRAGHLKPSPRWGAGPKMFGACIVGYIFGKFSYQQKCVEKLMAIPNSPLGEMLRQKRGRIGFKEAISMEPGFQSAASSLSEKHASMESSLFTDVGDVRPMSSFDSESSTFTDYGKSYDTTEQMLNDDNLPPKRPQFTTTYDELRKQNRDEHELRSQQTGLSSLSNPPGPSKRFTTQQLPAPKEGSQGQGVPRVKNKYGDVWDDKSE